MLFGSSTSWQSTAVRLHPDIRVALRRASADTGKTHVRIINEALAMYLGVPIDWREVRLHDDAFLQADVGK